MKAIYSVPLKLWLPLLVAGTFILLLSIMTWMNYQDRIAEFVKVSQNSVSQDMASLQREMEEELRVGAYVRAGKDLAARGTNIRYQVLVALNERGRILHATRFALKNQQAEQALAAFEPLRFVQMQRNNRPDIRLDADRQNISIYFPLTLTHTSEMRSRRSGGLFAIYDLSSGRAEIWAQVLRASLSTGLLLLVMMVFLIWFLQRFVTHPISHLVRVAGLLAKGGGVHSDIHGSGELVGLGEAFNEMSEQLEEQNEILRESEARYRALAEETPAWICRFLPGGELTYVNETYCQYTEMGFGEMVGSCFVAWLTEAEREVVMGKLSALTIESPNCTHEHQVLMPDGDMRWQHWSTRALFDAEGRAVLFQSIGEDISERKQAEQLSMRLSRILEHSLNEIYIFDSETFHFIDVNLGARNNLGYSMEELKKLTPVDLKPDVSAEEFAELISPLRSGVGQQLVFTSAHRRKDGTEYPIEVHLQLMNDDSSAFLAIIMDITERERSDKALRRAQKMDAIGQLSGGIAHDFNNILGIILGNLELLEAEMGANDKARKRLNNVKKSAKRATALTKQLLGFSRHQAARVEISHVNHLIEDMESLIARAVTPCVEVEHVFAEALWHTEIDRGDFSDALLNLILNARDSMPDGGRLTLETCNCELDATYCAANPGATPGEYVQLTVSDSGEGILPELLERIFEPFFSTKPEGKGTGMGLAMVYGFVKRSGGYINVYSELGIGTTLRLYLPRNKGEEQPSEAIIEPTESLPRGHECILVVDDEEDLLELARESLQALGYRVVTASNGLQALGRLSLEPAITLLFSDVVMPGGINGFELAEKAIVSRPDLKVLLTSGYTSKAVARNGQARFSANMLSKPYTQAKLAQQVRALLDGVGVADTGPDTRPPSIAWTPELSVGVAAMDEDHQVLMDLLNRSQLAAARGDESICQVLLEQLQDFSKRHLQREEAVMAACAYPGLDNHRQVHQLLFKQIEKMHGQCRKDGLSSIDLVNFLNSWWVDHIQGMDRAYGAYCEGKDERIVRALEQISPANGRGKSS